MKLVQDWEIQKSEIGKWKNIKKIKKIISRLRYENLEMTNFHANENNTYSQSLKNAFSYPPVVRKYIFYGTLWHCILGFFVTNTKSHFWSLHAFLWLTPNDSSGVYIFWVNSKLSVWAPRSCGKGAFGFCHKTHSLSSACLTNLQGIFIGWIFTI